MQPVQVSSRENPLVKEAIRLGGSRKARNEEKKFVAEGHKLCLEGVRSGFILQTLFLTDGTYPLGEENGLAFRAQKTVCVPESLMKKMSTMETPPGVLGIFLQKEEEEALPCAGRLLVLDRLQDPGNVGTIIRSCEAFGVNGLILSPDCADVFSPKVLRATMGGAFRLPLYYSANLPETLTKLEESGIVCYAALLNPQAQKLSETHFEKQVALVIGNEAAGICPEAAACCSKAVYIDMKGKAESLNAAVAASILAWELSRSGIKQ